MEIYTFDKSLQERLVEFNEILSSRGDIVPASEIQSEWSYHVELVIEPTGWQALWKIPRLTCQDLEIHYPTIVAVEVEQVNFKELTALVKITAVQDEIHLPEKYDVPLIELYPTLRQENSALDMEGTSNCIDQLRFFFNYLWMPWDTDSDDNPDWVSTHLEPRIRLFFDMKRGIVSKDTCDVIRTLVRESREIQTKIARFEADIADEEEEYQKNLLDEGKMCQMMKLHFRLQQIKSEMEVLENPAMREVLVRNRGSIHVDIEDKRRESRGNRPEGHFVWLGGSLAQTVETLHKIQSFLSPDMFFKTLNCFQAALDASKENDIIILGEGEHEIRGAGGLEEGGIIKGISNQDITIIAPIEAESGPSLLDFSGGEVLLQNLSVDLRDLQAGILVRTGIVKIENCKIYVTNQSVTKLGVVILANTKLLARRTTFVGLGTAVVIHSSGEAILEECTFKDCVEGVQLQDDCKLEVKNCYFSDFKEYGIRMETQKYLNNTESKMGGSELLQNVSEVSLLDCRFDNNGKGHVALKSQLYAFPVFKQKDSNEMIS
ncbi:protein nessun dorma [Orussus abietinus]|uniref:protein nessun dorma n=1 Tax=Orussus abietinus TaxID=222816 RepID=UPI0006260C46|nr:protein nessun dorma [Orussus abietinus]XP_012270159.1 protein nessun dorma [Orussus abietinus]